MTECTHRVLVLCPREEKKLRCRRCHLTISRAELGRGYCPECYEERGLRHDDFEEVAGAGEEKVRYQCETCPLIVECDP